MLRKQIISIILYFLLRSILQNDIYFVERIHEFGNNELSRFLKKKKKKRNQATCPKFNIHLTGHIREFSGRALCQCKNKRLRHDD